MEGGVYCFSPATGRPWNSRKGLGPCPSGAGEAVPALDARVMRQKPSEATLTENVRT